MVGWLRSPSPPQIPPLDFEETFWPGPFIFTEPLPAPSSSSVHSGQSLYNGRVSIDSGVGQSTLGSQRILVGYQQSEQSSIQSGLTAPRPLSPLDVALTTRVSIYKTSRQQAGVITTATMEGLIHYLLLKSAGERFILSTLSYTYKLDFRERQEGTRHFFHCTPSFYITFGCSWNARPPIQ
jgi:hypothetical protein